MRLLPLKLLALGCLLAACVTVNVYFPAAAAAEQAADRIIDTVTSQPPARRSPTRARRPVTKAVQTTLPPQKSTEPEGPPNAQVLRKAEQPVLMAAAGALLDLLVPVAEAQANPNLDVSDPQIRAVTASMQQRFGGLKKYFDSGVIGLTADGKVAISRPERCCRWRSARWLRGWSRKTTAIAIRCIPSWPERTNIRSGSRTSAAPLRAGGWSAVRNLGGITRTAAGQVGAEVAPAGLTHARAPPQTARTSQSRHAHCSRAAAYQLQHRSRRACSADSAACAKNSDGSVNSSSSRSRRRRRRRG